MTSQLVIVLEEFLQAEYKFLSMTVDNQTTKELETQTQNVKTHLQKVSELFKKDTKGILLETVNKLSETIKQINPCGQIDEVTVASLENQRNSFVSNIITTMQRHVQKSLLHIRSLVIQFIGCIATKNSMLFVAIVTS